MVKEALWLSMLSGNDGVSVSTGMSPFMGSLGYHPPLFEVQEDEVAVPSVQANMGRCRRVWRQVSAALLPEL